ncbi:unnamed protein product [Strongylus vulgaris]|uniref:NOPS domain-containing protein n=1 Tax=Strongylus vulgaris TaxID=40348 RepID=A0A3P7LJY0_STRVU|nr:unnamed protein product [Strongylus vulgaris]
MIIVNMLLDITQDLLEKSLATQLSCMPLWITTLEHIRSPKPLVVEILEPRDEDDGLAERMIPRTSQLIKERELGPRFPSQNTFEFVYGMKWKELYAMEKQRRAQLEEELKEARRRLESDMELAYQDYQAQMLREGQSVFIMIKLLVPNFLLVLFMRQQFVSFRDRFLYKYHKLEAFGTLTFSRS